MADILWMKWQVQHIERRHGVPARQFEAAWEDPDREELAEQDDPEWDPLPKHRLDLGGTVDRD